MKILIFSDNHRDSSFLNDFKLMKDIDFFISLGDSEIPKAVFDQYGIIGVRGNAFFDPPYPVERVMQFGDYSVLITHGHQHGVKYGIDKLFAYANSKGVNICCFGHTHSYFLNVVDGILFVNPGSISFPKYPHSKTYALLEIENSLVQAKIIAKETNKTLITVKYQK